MKKRPAIGLALCGLAMAGLAWWAYRRAGVALLPIVAAVIAAGCFVAMAWAWRLDRQATRLVRRAAGRAKPGRLDNPAGGER